jgi:phosphoserine phosphatase
MDSTIINCSVSRLLNLAESGRVSAITEQAMRGSSNSKRRCANVAMLKACRSPQPRARHAERIRLNPGARAWSPARKAVRADSGVRQVFSSPPRGEAGFERTGQCFLDDGWRSPVRCEAILVAQPTRRAQTPARALDRAERDARGRDGAGDLAMIKRAGMGVAYHAKPIVAAAAGASVTTAITALLYLQGYRDERLCGIESPPLRGRFSNSTSPPRR